VKKYLAILENIPDQTENILQEEYETLSQRLHRPNAQKEARRYHFLVSQMDSFFQELKRQVFPAGCCGKNIGKKKSMDVVIPSFAGIYNSGPRKDRLLCLRMPIEINGKLGKRRIGAPQGGHCFLTSCSMSWIWNWNGWIYDFSGMLMIIHQYFYFQWRS